MPLATFALTALLASCATVRYTPTPALTATSAPGYRMTALAPRSRDDVLLFVSLSGGGIRAAALSYGVLETLKAADVDATGASLLDDVDIVNSVSGGSLVAAGLAAGGPQQLASIEPVLYEGLQSAVVHRWLSPRGLWRTAQPRFGRSDLVQEAIDERLLHGTTYGDLVRDGHRPMVILRATDMARGVAFDFTQENFDRFCGDLSPMPLSRAVAASMAVPVVLSAVTLEGHGTGCRVTPRDMDEVDERHFIHLLDGGLVDNLGVRAPIDYIERFGSLDRAAAYNGLQPPRRVAFIVVNSEAVPDYDEDDRPETPGVLRTFNAWVDIPIRRSTRENLSLLRQRIEVWKAESPPDRQYYYIEVNLRRAPDGLQARLNRIPTSLALPRAEVDLLREVARSELAADAGYRQLLQDLGNARAADR